MKEELKQFDINIDDIKLNNNLFDNIHEAVEKMKLYTLSNRFEVVLNNNLIEAKDKYTGFRTILGCRISYDNLDKNISFVVREDNKPTYEELENIIKEVREYIKEDRLYMSNGEVLSIANTGCGKKILEILDKENI